MISAVLGHPRERLIQAMHVYVLQFVFEHPFRKSNSALSISLQVGAHASSIQFATAHSSLGGQPGTTSSETGREGNVSAGSFDGDFACCCFFFRSSSSLFASSCNFCHSCPAMKAFCMSFACCLSASLFAASSLAPS